jgi:hypothetical protein
MTLWEDYLITQVCRAYGLSGTEQEVLLAKFPNEDEKSSIKNNHVADLSLKNDKLPCSTETIDKHMRTIYKKLGCPENSEAFPGYNQKKGQARDPEFLAWIKPKYLEWKKNRIDPPPPPPKSVNPFIPRNGMIDTPQQFFDRSREIRNIFETLNSGSSVAIIGQSAIGKSSLLMEICRQAPNKLTTPRQPIYLELNGCRSENLLYSRLATKIGIEISNRDLYSALQKQKLLLALDNVECPGFTRSVRDCLRSLAEGSQSPLKLVIAATKFLDELFNDSQDGGTSPLAGICQNEVLKPWNEEIIRKFIDSRLKAPWLTPVTNPVSFTEEEITRLIAESGGHPQKLMQLCYKTYDAYLNEIK